jgi:hypothetical protein
MLAIGHSSPGSKAIAWVSTKPGQDQTLASFMGFVFLISALDWLR